MVDLENLQIALKILLNVSSASTVDPHTYLRDLYYLYNAGDKPDGNSIETILNALISYKQSNDDINEKLLSDVYVKTLLLKYITELKDSGNIDKATEISELYNLIKELYMGTQYNSMSYDIENDYLFIKNTFDFISNMNKHIKQYLFNIEPFFLKFINKEDINDVLIEGVFINIRFTNSEELSYMTILPTNCMYFNKLILKGLHVELDEILTLFLDRIDGDGKYENIKDMLRENIDNVDKLIDIAEFIDNIVDICSMKKINKNKINKTKILLFS